MKEKLKQLKELGFKANHRWYEIADNVLNNPSDFSPSDTLKDIKSKLGLDTPLNKVQRSPKTETTADTTETEGAQQHQRDQSEQAGDASTDAPAGADSPADYDIDSVNADNRRRMLAMMGEGGGTDGIGDNIDNAGEPSPRKPRAKKDVPKPEHANMITGYLLLVIMDMLIPSAICFAYNRFTDKGKAKPIDATRLRMDAKEIKELTPIADEVAKSIGGGMSPLTALLIGYGSMTIGKFMSL